VLCYYCLLHFQKKVLLVLMLMMMLQNLALLGPHLLVLLVLH
jgi:hypothetical protein